MVLTKLEVARWKSDISNLNGRLQQSEEKDMSRPGWSQRLVAEFPEKLDPDRFKHVDGYKESIQSVLRGERPLCECAKEPLVNQLREIIQYEFPQGTDSPILILPVIVSREKVYFIYRRDYIDLRKDYVNSFKERNTRMQAEDKQIERVSRSSNLSPEVQELIMDLKTYQRIHDYYKFDGKAYHYSDSAVSAFGKNLDEKINALEKRIQSHKINVDVLEELGLKYLAHDVDVISDQTATSPLSPR